MERRDLLPGYEVVIDPDEDLLVASARLVQGVSRMTGYPDPTRWPGDSLFEHTRERHGRSMLRLVVTEQALPRVPVAHGLLLRPLETPWCSWEEPAALYAQGSLAESGSTAVHPAHQRRGIARAMQRIRRDYAGAQGWRICASTWVGGPSTYLYEGSPEWELLGERITPKTQRAALYWLQRSSP